MTSQLIITSVERLQLDTIAKMKSLKGKIGIYVSLNKTQKSTEEMLNKAVIDTTKMFFIDCVSKEKVRDDVLHIGPENLEMLSAAIQAFIKDISGEKFIIIDALSTLLIYNNENKVAKFVRELTEYASENKVYVIAFSPKTQGEELLNKIFNFFDEVEKK
jgi:archaellum biogenesis ATPase FlaH